MTDLHPRPPLQPTAELLDRLSVAAGVAVGGVSLLGACGGAGAVASCSALAGGSARQSGNGGVPAGYWDAAAAAAPPRLCVSAVLRLRDGREGGGVTGSPAEPAESMSEATAAAARAGASDEATAVPLPRELPVAASASGRRGSCSAPSLPAAAQPLVSVSGRADASCFASLALPAADCADDTDCANCTGCGHCEALPPPLPAQQRRQLPPKAAAAALPAPQPAAPQPAAPQPLAQPVFDSAASSPARLAMAVPEAEAGKEAGSSSGELRSFAVAVGVPCLRPRRPRAARRLQLCSSSTGGRRFTGGGAAHGSVAAAGGPASMDAGTANGCIAAPRAASLPSTSGFQAGNVQAVASRQAAALAGAPANTAVARSTTSSSATTDTRTSAATATPPSAAATVASEPPLALYGRADHAGGSAGAGAPALAGGSVLDRAALAGRAMYLLWVFLPFLLAAGAMLLLSLLRQRRAARCRSAAAAHLDGPVDAEASRRDAAPCGGAASPSVLSSTVDAAAVVEDECSEPSGVSLALRKRAWLLLHGGCRRAGAAYIKWGQVRLQCKRGICAAVLRVARPSYLPLQCLIVFRAEWVATFKLYTPSSTKSSSSQSCRCNANASLFVTPTRLHQVSPVTISLTLRHIRTHAVGRHAWRPLSRRFLRGVVGPARPGAGARV